MAGLYDASQTQTIGRMLEGQENVLIPVANWAMYAEGGGAKGLIDWYPVEQVVMVLQQLQAQFESCKAALYEVTGMSDITRGATNQYETAKAQEIKAGFASVRMNGYSRDVSTFVTQILAIMGEIITQLYGDQKLQQVVGKLPDSDMALVPEALTLLRNDFLSGCRVSVKADTLVQADWALEKGQRTELTQVVSQFLQQAVPAIQQVPELAPLLVGMLKFTIVGYKGSAEIEGQLDQMLDAVVKKALEPPEPPPPTPEEQKIQLEREKMTHTQQLEQQKLGSAQQLQQQQAATDQQRMAQEYQLKQMETNQSMALEKQKADLQMAQMREKHAMEMEKLQMQAVSDQQKMAMQAQSDQQKMQTQVVQSELDRETQRLNHEQQLEQSAESHEQKLIQTKDGDD